VDPGRLEHAGRSRVRTVEPTADARESAVEVVITRLKVNLQ